MRVSIIIEMKRKKHSQNKQNRKQGCTYKSELNTFRPNLIKMLRYMVGQWWCNYVSRQTIVRTKVESKP